jgi:hypothetical protein
MQLMPISLRSYLKPYAQHHQHIPLPSMYQDHHIPSQYMFLNLVPNYTMHQPCTKPVPPLEASMYMHINLYQPCANHAHHPCTSTMYIITCTIPCTTNHMPRNVSQPYTISSINHVSYIQP